MQELTVAMRAPIPQLSISLSKSKMLNYVSQRFCSMWFSVQPMKGIDYMKTTLTNCKSKLTMTVQ